jgi:dipeptidyl aminopeptidase/acylaminoacyl peptidase
MAALAALAALAAAAPLHAQLISTHSPKLSPKSSPTSSPKSSPTSSLAAAKTGADTKYTIDDFLSPSEPLEVSASHKANRIGWATYERGVRNIYTAAAPDFKPVRITKFTEDDGVDLGGVQISDDGSIAIFIRGTTPNRSGWVANPSHDPNGGERAVWAARTDGSGAWRLANLEGTEQATGGFGGGRGAGPALSPDGKYVVFVKNGEIYRARVARGVTASVDTGGVPFIDEWGRQSDPVWSPDGTKLAFVSTRENHSLIGVYDMKARTVSYLSPSVDFDTSPTWSADGKSIAFIRKPGTPFGAQSQQGNGQFFPAGPAAAAAAAAGGRGGRGGGRGGARGGGGGRFGGDTVPQPADGLYRAAFPGGYTISFMIADVAHSALSGTAREFWHNQPSDRVFNNISSITLAGDNVVFGAQRPNDEWDRYFSVSVTTPQQEPVLLTTTDGLINDSVADRTFVTTAVSHDGKTFFYCTNANDIEKRHIWSVPVTGGTPVQISTDDGVEVSPTPLPSGKSLAVLYFNYNQPASIGIVPADGGKTKIVFPTLPKRFPQAAHVDPQIVITHPADNKFDIHNQLFLPADLKPGERRPAIIFVHGGPQREMLPAYHYMQFYHWAYGFDQWLQTQGYIVLSVNYRSGVGYGRSFQRAPGTESRGNSEYQDVVAGGKYLQSRPDVDPTRIGIWGLSYGGLLTAEALARNSDIFVAGVDLAGVHLYGSTIDTTNLGYESSAAAHVDTWKSPVFLEQGDDDRNVDFAQMVGMVDLLRAHHIYYELTVNPDDVHESLEYNRWMYIFNRGSDFLHRFVWDKETPPVMSSAAGTNGMK